MKRFAAMLSLLVPVAAGAARWLDLVNFTDLATGFCTLWPVWYRYACLGLVLALGLLASRLAARCPEGLLRRSRCLGLLCVATGAAYALYTGVKLVRLRETEDLATLEGAVTVLYLFTALWLLLLGVSRLSGYTGAPSARAWVGVLGTAAFFLLTVHRFSYMPTGIVRVVPTLEVFSALAALLLMQGAVKAFYLPRSGAGRGLFFRGYAAFTLCTCLELPQSLCLYLVGQADRMKLAESAVLGMVGLIGLGCCLLAVCAEQTPAEQTE